MEGKDCHCLFKYREAEDYRFYWNKKKPNWIVKENENWEGKYWSPEWKSIIKKYQKN